MALKILHILSTPRAEGTPNLVLDWLATGLHEQEVFVLNAQPADLTARLRSAARWYGEGNYFSMDRRKFFAITASIRRVCRDRRPDLLVCWPTGFSNLVCLGARLAGVRRLLVHCGNPPNRGCRGDWITRYVMWPVAALGARCVCCSNYVRNQFCSIPLVPANLFHVVYNSVRTEEVAKRAAVARQARPVGDALSGIMVATLERHKDHATLLAALPRIVMKQPSFRLRLVGDGSLRAELETLAQHHSVAHAVTFLGMRRDVPEQLGQSDVFIFSTTVQEGLGSVLLEALAAGVPVVASDVPACRELLVGGRYGTLVPGHNPQALADSVLAALHDPRRSAFDAADYVLGFSPQAMMNEYFRLAGIVQEPFERSA